MDPLDSTNPSALPPAPLPETPITTTYTEPPSPKFNLKNWFTNHKLAGWSALAGLVLLITLPILLLQLSRPQFTTPKAWTCSSAQSIDNGDGTYNIIVTQGSAAWWRLVKLPANQVVAGPQNSKVFNQIPLSPGEYQVNASDNGQQWTTQNCTFTIGEGQSLQCTNIKLYTTTNEPLTINDIFVNQTIHVAVSGVTTDPQGITKARFSFDNGTTWTETTTKNSNNEFYLEWQVPNSTNDITILSQIFNPTLGWR